ncbi:hypothetical protein [Aliikangiella maris]|uniref:Uncharacterized protein n=2 Tax=Aliikangiella maris TaxID=3162458 RepID=A0ABV3MS04_9GAMM
MSENFSNINDDQLEKISGYLDGELTQQEAQKVALLIETDVTYKKLYEELMTMRHEVQSLSLQEQELIHLDRLFKEPVAKTSRILGLTLIGLSGVVLVLITFYKIFLNPEIGLLEKVLVGAIGGGGLLLLFSVLRQRIMSAKNDKYKRVKI